MTAIASPGACVPHPWLVADIGGTNARFGWIDGEGAEGAVITQVQTVPVLGDTGPLTAARAYLAQVAQALGPRFRAPAGAAWAVATAIVGDEVGLTNAGWRFSRRELQRELGLRCFLLLNDFEALALSLPRLRAEQLRRVGEAPGQAAVPWSTRAVIGPGTGLGVAGLVAALAPGLAAGPDTEPHWLAVPGEGGHASLAADDEAEWALLAAVQRHHGHVSAERLLSGIGLPTLHQAVATVQDAAVPMWRTEEIVAAGTAAAGSPAADPLCRQTLEHFCALLGGFVGNAALTLGARGGVYIGGGIVPRLGDLFLRSRFRARFEAKGRLAPYLQTIPTWLIVDAHAALSGAAMALQQHRAG